MSSKSKTPLLPTGVRIQLSFLPPPPWTSPHSFLGAYYAAQEGISIKASAPANRKFLSELLTALESLRSTIGPSDAVDVEAVSSVYVEDFALRVFNVADNEDRNGKATRSTAKKFLAAATFLDVLKVFEDKRPWESVRFALGSYRIASS
jgi:vacuolar protein sorting-associated protein VTA1